MHASKGAILGEKSESFPFHLSQLELSLRFTIWTANHQRLEAASEISLPKFLTSGDSSDHRFATIPGFHDNGDEEERFVCENGTGR